MSELRNLAANISALEYGELPTNVLKSARLCLLDALGCGLYGSTLSEGKQLIAALAQLSAGGIPAWGGGRPLSRGDCALAGGALCHLRELDDVHYSITHPGAVVVPAVYAMAYGQGKTMADILLAIVCGYEATVRISKGSGFLSHRQKGWHATATMGAFGAAAAGGKLLGLDEQLQVWALGLAGSRTGGTWAFKADGAMSKRLHPGLAARDGVTAAYLAGAGLSGPEYVLEAEDGGFYRVACDDWDLAALTRDWKRVWAVAEVEYKWYAACKSVHSPLEAALDIYRRAPRKAADIAAVKVGINSSAMAMAGSLYRRDSVASAQLSIPYGVALGLTGRPGMAEDFAAAAITDEQLFALAQKVAVHVSPAMEELRLKQHKSAAQVEVLYTDGTKEYQEVHDAKGHLGQPLDAQAVTDKFLALAATAVGQDKAQAIRQLVVESDAALAADQLFSLLG